MRTHITRLAAGVAAIAVTSLAFVSGEAAALPAGSAAAGTSVLAPLSGTNAGTFTLTPPSGAACPGDSASGGYRWQTFFTSTSVDPATLTYGLSGPVQQGSEFSRPLYSSVGQPQVNKTTAVTTGLITPIPLFGWDATLLPVPNGTYNVGYACTTSGTTQKFWSTPITISNSTASSFSYSFGAVPAAPVLGASLTPGDQSLDGTFTHAASTPATTGYTVTAVPTAGATVTLSLPAGSTSFSLSGLVNGTSYAVTVVATNTAGNSAASNTVNGTPSPSARPAVTSLAASPGTGNVVLSWVAPTGVAPTGYDIAVSPAVAGSPFSAPAGTTSFPVNGTPGTLYTYTVTPTHPSPYVGTAASISATPNAAQVIIQDVTVVRPAGALVLTQRCGVNGALPQEPASPGFAVLPPVVASADQVGTAPTLTVGGAADPQFGSYPSPSTPTYPTHCGVNLGTGQFITTGSLAGQYYAASGILNQVTVSDTRDTDTGWTVNGTMSDFTVAGGGASFSGNQLGWTPVVSDDSDLTLAGYDQVATAGASVLPATAAGLATAKPLASAAAGHGLGIATFDARLKVLIPSSVRAGTYNGTLTFTVI